MRRDAWRHIIGSLCDPMAAEARRVMAAISWSLVSAHRLGRRSYAQRCMASHHRLVIWVFYRQQHAYVCMCMCMCKGHVHVHVQGPCACAWACVCSRARPRLHGTCMCMCMHVHAHYHAYVHGQRACTRTCRHTYTCTCMCKVHVHGHGPSCVVTWCRGDAPLHTSGFGRRGVSGLAAGGARAATSHERAADPGPPPRDTVAQRSHPAYFMLLR